MSHNKRKEKKLKGKSLWGIPGESPKTMYKGEAKHERWRKTGSVTRGGGEVFEKTLDRHMLAIN